MRIFNGQRAASPVERTKTTEAMRPKGVACEARNPSLTRRVASFANDFVGDRGPHCRMAQLQNVQTRRPMFSLAHASCYDETWRSGVTGHSFVGSLTSEGLLRIRWIRFASRKNKPEANEQGDCPRASKLSKQQRHGVSLRRNRAALLRAYRCKRHFRRS